VDGDAELPRIGSDAVLKALARLGFKKPKHKTKGSHTTLRRECDPPDRCTVVQGKSEIPGPTLASILKQGNVTTSEFLIALGGAHARAERQRLKQAEKNTEPRQA